MLYNFNVLKMSTPVAWHAILEKLFKKIIFSSFFSTLNVPFQYCVFNNNKDTHRGDGNVIILLCLVGNV